MFWNLEFGIWNLKNRIVLVFVLCLFMAGCMPSPYFQREEPVPQNAWTYDFKPTFKFDINDTNASYIPYFVIRHTDAYPFSNVYIWVYAKQPGDTSFHKSRVNIQLAENTGKWLGRGMGEIYEQYMPLTLSETDRKRFFKKKGTYEIQLEQNMRVDPLPEILHVGLRIEKVQ